MQRIFLVVLSIFMLVSSVHAHGGDQRLVEGKYILSFSRAPFTPHVGQKTILTFYISDALNYNFVTDTIRATVKIAKLGDITSSSQNYIFETRDISTQNGEITVPFTFTEPVLHEVFLEFSVVKDGEKVYVPTDFLIDVQEKELGTNNIATYVGIGILGFLIGFFAHAFWKRSRVTSLPA